MTLSKMNDERSIGLLINGISLFGTDCISDNFVTLTSQCKIQYALLTTLS